MSYARAHLRQLCAVFATALVLSGASSALSGILIASASSNLEIAEGLGCEPIGGKFKDPFCLVQVGSGKYEEVALNQNLLSEETEPFVMELLSFPLSIECGQQEAEGNLTTSGGKTTGEKFEVSLSECSDDTWEACGVRSPGQSIGSLVFVVNVALAQGEGAGYVLFTPQTGEILFMIEYVGEDCPLAEIDPSVEGEIAGETSAPGSNLSIEQPLTFSKAVTAGTETGLTFFEEPLFLSGKAVQELASGDAWGIS